MTRRANRNREQGEAGQGALSGRDNVVMVRVNDQTLEHLDALVEAGLFRSRSESAAYLIGEGIQSNRQLFNQIRDVVGQIASLREKLKGSLHTRGEQAGQKRVSV